MCRAHRCAGGARQQARNRFDADATYRSYTLQHAVSAIRESGATSQYILLPGKQYSHPQTYTNAGGLGDGDSGADILSITDMDGGSSKLVIDVHQYLDVDSSGKHTECTNNGISDSIPGGVGLESLTRWLRAHGRVAMLTETGGGNTDSCVGFLQQQLDFVKYVIATR